MEPLYAASLKKKKITTQFISSTELFNQFCVEARRLPLCLSALLQKVLSCVARLTVLPLFGTKALSLAAMQPALCDKA